MAIEKKKADAVFEGGGVKGIGLIGALEVLEAEYQWRLVAGTSAGAIVGSLVAAGYPAQDLVEIMQELDYRRFKDEGFLDKLGIMGMGASVLFEKGIYEGDFLETWIGGLLAKRGVKTFKDLPAEAGAPYPHRLQVITADITNGRLVVLPQGLRHYGIDPDSFSVARAVRMSMSIPFFFEPVVIDGVHFVDGGLLSNFPVWLFDRQGATIEEQRPRWPTIGFKLIDPDEGQPADICTVFSFTRQVIYTALEAHDRRHVETLDFLRTVGIPTTGVKTTDFDLTEDQQKALYVSGKQAATRFLSTWDHDAYVEQARFPKVAAAAAKVDRWRQRVRRLSAATVGSQVYR